jgi:hypothetical protein
MTKKKKKCDKIYAEELTPAIVRMKDKSEASKKLAKEELENQEEATNETIEELLRGPSARNNK